MHLSIANFLKLPILAQTMRLLKFLAELIGIGIREIYHYLHVIPSY